MDVFSIGADQMVAVERIAIEDYGLTIHQMLELAGNGLAEVCRMYLGGSVKGRHVFVLAGAGRNGAGGLVAARSLANWGASVTAITTAQTQELSPESADKAATLEAMSIPLLPWHTPDCRKMLDRADLIVDALIGCGLTTKPLGPNREMIRSANAAAAPTIALDVPSGLNAGTGKPYPPTIDAVRTVTLAAPKTGLYHPAASPFVGEVWLVDIGIPPEVYSSLGLPSGRLFETAAILRARAAPPAEAAA